MCGSTSFSQASLTAESTTAFEVSSYLVKCVLTPGGGDILSRGSAGGQVVKVLKMQSLNRIAKWKPPEGSPYWNRSTNSLLLCNTSDNKRSK